jgi:hypothetical protein
MSEYLRDRIGREIKSYEETILSGALSDYTMYLKYTDRIALLQEVIKWIDTIEYGDERDID